MKYRFGILPSLFAVFILQATPLSSALEGLTVKSTPFHHIESVLEQSPVASNGIEKRRYRTLENLSGTAFSRPCCVASTMNHIDCFIRGPSSSVLHKKIFKTDGEAMYSTEWEDLGGFAVDEIECVVRNQGRIDAFTLGKNSSLCVKSYENGEWSIDWLDLKGNVLDVPSCVSIDGKRLDCQGRHLNDNCYIISHVEGKWTDCKKVEGQIRYPITCLARSPSIIDCFGSKWPGLELTNSWKKSGDTHVVWADHGIWAKGKPSVVSWVESRMDAFALGQENDAVHASWDADKGWHVSRSLGGNFEFSPECLTNGMSKIHCFAVGHHSHLYINSCLEIAWTGWIKLEVQCIESPACVVYNEVEVACYCRNSYKEIVEIDFGNI